MTTWDDNPNDYEHAVAKLAEARAVIRDLLSSYLATFGGNKDELAFRAERFLEE